MNVSAQETDPGQLMTQTLPICPSPILKELISLLDQISRLRPVAEVEEALADISFLREKEIATKLNLDSVGCVSLT